jgi:hypothetical protein
MNYQFIYEQLINKAKERNWTKKTSNCYVETHHIKPRILFPELIDDSFNLVCLTAREHFIAHLLLAKIYGGSMIYAANAMMYKNRKKYNNKQYSWLKEKFSDLMSDKFSGISQSEEHINKRVKKTKGKKRTDKSKKLYSEAAKIRWNSMSEEERKLENRFTPEQVDDIRKKKQTTHQENFQPRTFEELYGEEKAEQMKQNLSEKHKTNWENKTEEEKQQHANKTREIYNTYSEEKKQLISKKKSEAGIKIQQKIFEQKIDLYKQIAKLILEGFKNKYISTKLEVSKSLVCCVRHKEHKIWKYIEDEQNGNS